MEYKFNNSILQEMYKFYYEKRYLRRPKALSNYYLFVELFEKYRSSETLPEKLKFSGNYNWKIVNNFFSKLGFTIIRYRRVYGKTEIQIKPIYKKSESN